MASKRKPSKPNNQPEREPWTPWGKWLKARRERRRRRQEAREAHKEARRKARQRRWMRRRRLTARSLVFMMLMLLACGIGLAVQLIIGRPYPWEALQSVGEAVGVSHRLPERLARWESLAVEHYTVEIEYMDNADVWCGPAVLEVQRGRIVDAPSPGSTHWFPAQRCDDLMQQLIPDNAFDWLNAQLDSYTPGETMLSVEFDAEFGYPVSAQRAVYTDEEPPGCCWQVTWRDLRPVYED